MFQSVLQLSGRPALSAFTFGLMRPVVDAGLVPSGV